MSNSHDNEKITLAEVATQAMIDKGFIPEFPPQVLDEVSHLTSPGKNQNTSIQDLRKLLWVSIDNDDSLDLDQLTYAEGDSAGILTIYVAVADVDVLVPAGSAIDQYASYNTTSVYTPTKIFPMLPPQLSTNLTSLNENQDRLSVVVKMTIATNGQFEFVDIFSAWVRNYAKLTYNGVAKFLADGHPLPQQNANTVEIHNQLELQDNAAQRIKTYRNKQGALTFGVIELHPVVSDGQVLKLEETVQNQAQELIENYMIAANVCVTEYLTKNNLPTLRRIVRTPERWDRIVALAKTFGEKLPAQPDNVALSKFLANRRHLDPLTFPDVSLAIIKLIGRGEYIVIMPGEPSVGHFDLALKDYAHTTAPNRRYPDLIMQRLLKNHFFGGTAPYKEEQLKQIAAQCTQKEDDATKVERRVLKSAAAMVLTPQLGKTFPAMVTGAAEKGTWVRLETPPIEGKLIKGFEGLDVGDKLTVKLVHTDIGKGFIDFVRA